MTIQDLEDYPYLTKKLLEKDFSYLQIVDIIEVVTEVCRTCLDAPRDCQCWNDE